MRRLGSLRGDSVWILHLGRLILVWPELVHLIKLGEEVPEEWLVLERAAVRVEDPYGSYTDPTTCEAPLLTLASRIDEAIPLTPLLLVVLLICLRDRPYPDYSIVDRLGCANRIREPLTSRGRVEVGTLQCATGFQYVSPNGFIALGMLDKFHGSLHERFESAL